MEQGKERKQVMQYARSVGVIVFCTFDIGIKYLLIKHSKGHWAFPKGHMEEGETDIDTALRELEEETGLKGVRLINNEFFLSEEYIFKHGNDLIHKRVDYFIAESISYSVRIDGVEISDIGWYDLKTASQTLTFRKSKDILLKTAEIIKDPNLQ